jgi:hypothetical protein
LLEADPFADALLAADLLAGALRFAVRLRAAPPGRDLALIAAALLAVAERERALRLLR